MESSGTRPSLQEGANFLEEGGQIRFYDSPHDLIVDVGLSVGEDIAECDDPDVLSDARRGRWIVCQEPT
jgi:hypothetical protein